MKAKANSCVCVCVCVPQFNEGEDQAVVTKNGLAVSCTGAPPVRSLEGNRGRILTRGRDNESNGNVHHVICWGGGSKTRDILLDH